MSEIKEILFSDEHFNQVLLKPALEGGGIAGNENGTLVIIEFFDYNCKYCRIWNDKLPQVIKGNPELKVVRIPIGLLNDMSKTMVKYVAVAKSENIFAEVNSIFCQENINNEGRLIAALTKANIDAAKLQKIGNQASTLNTIITNTYAYILAYGDYGGVPRLVLTNINPPYLAKMIIPDDISVLQKCINQMTNRNEVPVENSY